VRVGLIQVALHCSGRPIKSRVFIVHLAVDESILRFSIGVISVSNGDGNAERYRFAERCAAGDAEEMQHGKVAYFAGEGGL